MTPVMHEFGHLLGLDHVDNNDTCTMGTAIARADGLTKTFPCAQEIANLKTTQNGVQNGTQFNLSASTSSTYPAVASTGWTEFVDKPAWNIGFADFSRNGTLNGNTNFLDIAEANSSLNWPDCNSGTCTQSSFYSTTNTQITMRPTVVLGNGMLWAFYRNDLGGGQSQLFYATSTDNVNWTNRGAVTNGTPFIVKTRSPVAASYDAARNIVWIAWTVWDENFPLPGSGTSCPTAGCTGSITMMEIPASTPQGPFVGPWQMFQTAVGAPGLYCDVASDQPTYTQCQLIWSGTDSARSLFTNFVEHFTSTGYSSSGSSSMNGLSDFPPSIDGVVTNSSSGGVVAAVSGTDGKIYLNSKNCGPNCGTFGGFFTPQGAPLPAGNLGPVIRADRVNRFYRVYSAN